jgi:hypothetical protein
MATPSSDPQEIADRIVDRLQDFFHIASGPNEDGTHSGFVVVDFETGDMGDGVSASHSVAFLPFDLSDEDEPTEITTSEDPDTAADAAEDMLQSLLDLISSIVVDELDTTA